MTMNVLLIGPPGSGKGTQGERLAKRLGLRHIAAGDLLRAEVEADTPLGREAKQYMDRGELVPDQLMIDLLMPVVIKAGQDGGYVLDGFPRSVAQAYEARWLAEQEGVGADAVIYLDAPGDELVERILSRAKVEGRADDTPDIVRKRLEVFDEATAPLVNYYRGRGLLHVVDASRPADEVTAKILSALGLDADAIDA
jgi:adenylate kinase